jgi:hypothetical protein
MYKRLSLAPSTILYVESIYVNQSSGKTMYNNSKSTQVAYYYYTLFGFVRYLNHYRMKDSHEQIDDSRILYNRRHIKLFMQSIYITTVIERLVGETDSSQ